MKNKRAITIPPGMYYFKGPQQVVASINQELLMVIPETQGCFFFLLQPNPPSGLLLQQLSQLASQVKSKKLKLFGASYAPKPLLDRIRKWCKANEIEVLVNDVGGSVRRRLSVDCSTGNTRVAYERLLDYQNQAFDQKLPTRALGG